MRGVVVDSILNGLGSESVPTKFGDSASLDSFSRLRISDQASLFSVQCQYNNEPLIMESGNTGTGVLPAHSANDRMVNLSVAAGSGTSFIQSYQYIPYQPGKSQLIFLTAVIGTAVSGAVVDLGYFDAANGILLRQNGVSGLQLIRRTSTSGSVVNNAVNQSDWNLDKLNGSGASGITLDTTKSIILVIDLQFLGMGRVRVGFDIDGLIIYVHEFLNANVIAVPYMQTATLPVQMLITATSTGSTKDAYFKCASVNSEGGLADDFAFSFATPEGTVTAGSGTRTHILSLRPLTTFNSLANRSTLILDSVDLFVTGNQPVRWDLCIGSTFSVAPTYAAVNAANSAYEAGTGGTLSGAGTVIASGYVAATAQSKTTTSKQLTTRYPITLDRAGAVRAAGTLSLLVSGIGGTSATRAVFNYKERR